MKSPYLIALFACSLIAPSLKAQTPRVTVGQKAPVVAVHKQVLPSPVSIRPALAARPSTSQAGPVHAGWKPLTVLPALVLVDRNGNAASLSTATDRPPHWFLLYRKAVCIPCDRLMLAIQGSSSPQLKAGKPYVIVVDSADKDALERVHTNFAGLSDATWTADLQKQTETTLKLHGSPVLIAMSGGQVAWRIAGSLDSTDTIVRITDGWLAQNATLANQPATISWSEANRQALAAQAAAQAAGAKSAAPLATPGTTP